MDEYIAKIENYAFSFCNSLNSLDISSTTVVQQNAFYESGIEKSTLTRYNPAFADLNNDGKVSIMDATTYQCRLGTKSPVVDVNRDNSTDITDVLILQKISTGSVY